VTWKKQPYAQLEVKQTYANIEATSRCRIVDTERGKVQNLFDYVKSKAKLERYMSEVVQATQRAPGNCGDDSCLRDVHLHLNATATVCRDADGVVVEDVGAPSVSIPWSKLSDLFDTKSASGRVLFAP
jgi:hypothetical protein